jgi:hypothetical protein
MQEIIAKTMITNLTDGPRKLMWIKGGLSLPAHEGKVVDGFYPTACHNPQSEKAMMADIKSGKVRLTIVTNLEISRTTGKDQVLDTVAPATQTDGAVGNTEDAPSEAPKRVRRSSEEVAAVKAVKALITDNNLSKGIEDIIKADADATSYVEALDKFTKLKDVAIRQEADLETLIAEGNVPDTDPEDTEGNMKVLKGSNQDTIKSEAHKSYEDGSNPYPQGSIEDYKPKAVSLDGSHLQASGPTSTVEVFSNGGHKEEGRVNNPYVAQEPDLSAITFSQSAEELISKRVRFTDEQREELRSRATGNQNTIVTRRDAVAFFAILDLRAKEDFHKDKWGDNESEEPASEVPTEGSTPVE